MQIPTHVVCHYGEIALKGKNRHVFEGALVRHIQRSLKQRFVFADFSVAPKRGRIVITLPQKTDLETTHIEDVLKKIPGIVYFAFAKKVSQDIDDIKHTAVEMLNESTFETFRVTTRRSDKTFPLSSQQTNEEVGGHIFHTLNKPVSLTTPDVTCFIDITQDGVFVFSKKIQGVGGLPNGTTGRAGVLLSGGIDSPVAAYYAMKRGLSLTAIHFHAMPYTSKASIEKIRELSTILARFQGSLKLFLIPLAPIQEAIAKECPEKLRVILYRRFMLRIAERIAEQESLQALVTGDSLGQVASQTIENMSVVSNATTLPVLRPLIGFDKQEIIEKAELIGTYNTSIQPHDDCCSLFVPKQPETKAKEKYVAAAEEKLDVESLVNQALGSLSVETIIPQNKDASSQTPGNPVL